jgi:FMN phosphatase YigB (HAD superfamily)
MTGQAITFDFHNTLAACPEWFELEVRHLPSSFLTRWSNGEGHQLASSVGAEADTRYRTLRRDIIEHGNELTAEECLRQVFADLEIEIPGPEIAQGIERLMRDAFATVAPVPGAVESVQAIHRAGVPVGIVSSAVYHPFLEWTIDRFGIRDAIGVVVTSASAGFYKSRPEIYWHAADLLDAIPQRMIHVGDSLRFDVGGAGQAGLGTVWLQQDGAEAPNGDFRPDLTLDTLVASAPEILALLAARLPSSDG